MLYLKNNQSLGRGLALLLALIVVVLTASIYFTDDVQKKLIILAIAFMLLIVLIIMVVLLMGKDAFFKKLTRSWVGVRSHAIDVPEYRVNARIVAKRVVQLNSANPPDSQYFISFVFDTGYTKEFDILEVTFSRLIEGQYGLLIFREKGQYSSFDAFKPYQQYPPQPPNA